jgi:hypothetical protein
MSLTAGINIIDRKSGAAAAGTAPSIIRENTAWASPDILPS